MKRRLIIISIFVLAGAVVNVAVAWGCVLVWLPEEDNEQLFFARQDTAVFLDSTFDADIPVDPRQCHEFQERRPGWFKRKAEWVPSDDDVGQFFHVTVLLAGWPVYSLEGYYLWELDSGRYESALVVPEWPRAGPRRLVHFLPLRPTWPGFAANTALYAAILWLPILGPFVLRRFIRVRRGLCPNCAYPMGQAAACSECGKQLPQYAVAET